MQGLYKHAHRPTTGASANCCNVELRHPAVPLRLPLPGVLVLLMLRLPNPIHQPYTHPPQALT
jgi:hypothetical protein